MRAYTELLDYMQEPLPPIGLQKRLPYRPSKKQAIYFYKLINESIFDNQLNMPEIEIMARCRKYWGMCYGEHIRIPHRQTFCKIRLMDKFYSRSWMISILAHEMCHQYTWDIIGPEREQAGKERMLSHGPTFFQFKEKLSEHGISLKISHRRSSWFKTQDFFKS